MPINPNIILGIKTPEIQQVDPLDRYAKSLTLKNLMAQGQMQDMALQDDQAIRDAYKQSGGDAKKVRDILIQGGQYKQVQALDKSNLETEDKRATIDKNKNEILIKSIAIHRDQLANVNGPQTAAQWVISAYQDPVLGPISSRAMPIEQALQNIPQDPQAFAQWKQQNALGATRFIELNKPTIHMQDTGGASNVLSIPGLGGAPQVVSSAKKTQTPDSIASNAIAIRGQNMTDARARETLGQGKIPQGYRQTADGNLQAIPGGPADLKLAGALNQDTQALTSSSSAMDRLATAANEAMNHPGLAGTAGLRGSIPNIPGSQAADAAALLNTLKSQVAFGVLQDMRNNSKTGGALGSVSDAEGKRLEANLAALEKSQSVEQLRASLRKIIDYTQGAKDRLSMAYNLKHGDGSVNPVRQNAPQPTQQPVSKVINGVTYVQQNGQWFQQ